MKIAAAAAVLGIAAAVAVMSSCTPEPPDTSVSAATPAALRSTPVVPAASAAAVPRAQATRAAAPSSARQAPTAAGGVAILASAARAQAVVTGVVSRVESIDLHGWRADLRIDRVLIGSVRLGETLTIGWEELSSTRQVRFADGQSVLVVLDALPTQSLWRKRFPARDRAHTVLVVASAGDAFVSKPDGVTLDALEHYLAMTASAREGAPGTERLAELVRGGYPAVAREALARFEGSSTLVAALDADGAAALLAAARSPEREPALRSAVLGLAAQHRLPGTRETALALTAPTSAIRPAAYRALASLPDGLSAEAVESLLVDADPELRAVGVEALRDDSARERYAALIRADPSPTVRLAAGRALLARQGTSGIPDVVALLDDHDDTVRSGIAESIGAFGAPAIAPLLAVVNAGSEHAALAAVLGISRTGPKAAVTLETIADTHAKESVRAFARLALGEAPKQPY